MNILVDENIPSTTVEELRAMGHDVIDIRGSSSEGIPDSSIWKMAQEGNRLFITTDKWFGSLREKPHFGVPLSFSSARI